MSDELKIHTHPVWRDRATMVLNMKIDSEDDILRHEQLLARACGDSLYEVCCIPFFIYDVALGDKLRITSHDGRNLVEGVAEASGHHTFRAWFGDSKHATVRTDVVATLERLGCLYEWFSDDLLAIDAPDDPTALKLAELLEASTVEGHLEYETGVTEEGFLGAPPENPAEV